MFYASKSDIRRIFGVKLIPNSLQIVFFLNLFHHPVCTNCTHGGDTVVSHSNKKAPVAQLDRALPSEGRGHTFESCRVRQLFQ
jgi:hypothetical protein